MQIIENIQALRRLVSQWRNQGLSVGLVPTMGYLHEGHASLIQHASKENDRVIATIFVNPTQFGKNEDLDNYPRDLENDRLIAENTGAAVIFHPTVEEMYPKGYATYVDVEGITEHLCGSSRPGHFRGVCTVVNKLFNITQADRAYFGEKDAQQVAVIERMVEDLNIPIEVISCPIVREPDGLAKSSRNSYLSVANRQAATVLNQALTLAKQKLEQGERNANIIRQLITHTITLQPLARIDYIEIVDRHNLQPVESVNDDILVAIAIFFDSTRLIDNFSFRTSSLCK